MRSRPRPPPEECANCGAVIPRGAKACPECGADERTGWRETSGYDGLDLPDEAWRDDSVRLAAQLSADGVSVQLEIADGMWHVWPLSGSFPEADAALECAAAFVRSCTR